MAPWEFEPKAVADLDPDAWADHKDMVDSELYTEPLSELEAALDGKPITLC